MVNGRENGSNHRGADRSAALGLLILLCAFFIFLGMPAGNADPLDAEETADTEEAYGDAVEDAVQTFLNGYRYSQVHTVPHYRKRNQVMSATYFDGRALALDGSRGLPDFCIPGLAEREHMIPQGIACLPGTDDVIISSYDADGSSPSILSVLDARTGRVCAVFLLQYPDGRECHSHVGGIAVSDWNLYITTKGSRIGCIPLARIRRMLDAVSSGNGMPVMSLGMTAETDLSSMMNGASTGYISVMDGVLYTGNFYHKNSAYHVSADPERGANSLVLAFPLCGNDAETEWENFAKCAPARRYLIPKEITKIQDAVVWGDRMYISSSYGRRHNSKFIIADVRKDESADPSGEEIYTLNTDGMTSLPAMPMIEGFCIRPENGRAYLISESGSIRYTGSTTPRHACDPTDTVWEIQLADDV